MAKNLQDTDLLLVNRGAESYKATFADFKDSLTTPLVIGEIFIKDSAGNVENPASNPPTISVGQQLTAEPQVSGGNPPYVNAFQWQRDGSNIGGATTSIYTVVSADVDKALTCVVTSTDSADPQNTATKTSNPTGTVQADAPDTPTLESPTNGSSIDGNNFTMLASTLAPSSQTLQSTTFQVSASESFSSTVVNETVAGSTSLTVQGKIDSGAMAYSTTYYARCLQTNSDGIDSEYSAINTFTTNEEPPQPTDVTMSGLRFDSSRSTGLRTTLDGITKYTFSVWIKPTAFPSSSGYIQQLGNKAFFINSSGNFAIEGTTSSKTAVLNEWQNVVLQATADGSTLFVNGEDCGVIGQPVTTNSPVSAAIGNNASSLAKGFDGYMSDLYLVSNQLLGPEVFGKSINNGTWVPRTNTEIKAVINAGPADPYDDRANTSQVWSSNTTATPSSGITLGSIENLYDGNPDTQVTIQGVGPTFPSGKVEMKLAPSPAISVAKSISFTYSTSQTTYYSINEEDTVALPPSANKTTFTIPFTGTLNEFRWQVQTNGQLININEVFIDGRPLVDTGVWNISQNWSNYISTPYGTLLSDAPATNAADGNLTTSAAPADKATTGNDPTLIFDITSIGGLAFTSSVRVYRDNGISTPGTTVQFNDETAVASNFKAWTTIATGSGTLNKITTVNTTSNNTVGIAAIEVDGAILVDAGTQYNTSQTWSANYENVDPTVASFAFDGDLTTQCYSAGTADAFFSINNVSATKVECYGFTTDGTFYVDGSARHEVSCAAGWVEIYSGSEITVNKLGFTRSGGSGGGNSAWRINGQVLVNGGFGPSGFYLPFDPDATGVNYSSMGTIVNPTSVDIGTTHPAYNPVNLYDGSLNTSWGTVGGTTKSQTGIAIPFTDTFQVMINSNVQGGVITFTGANGSTGSVDLATAGWVNGTTDTLYTPTGNLQSPITGFSWPGNGTGGMYLIAFYADGKIVVDHESIGVDDSGNNNDFYDQNFAVGNTSEVWSNNYTTSGTWVSSSPSDAFDGNSLSDKPYTPGDKTITFETEVAVTSSLTVKGGYYSNGNKTINFDVTYLDNSTQTLSLTTTSAPNYETFDLVNAGFNVSKGGFKKIVASVSGGINGDNWSLYYWNVDGKILVDTNIQDTVLDTPVRDYAVAATGGTITNGGLERRTDSGDVSSNSLTIDKSKKYYFEGIPIDGKGTSYVGFLTTSEQMAGGWAGRVDTGVGTGAFGTVSSSDIPNWTLGDVLGLAVDFPTSNITLFINGVISATGIFSNSSDASAYAFGAFSSATTHSQNFGQQPFAASNVTYDQSAGTVVIPELALQPYDFRANTSQDWSGGSVTTSGSVNANQQWSNMFDGNLTTQTDSSDDNANATATLALPTITWSTSVELYVQSNPVGAQQIIINGTSIGDTTVNNGWQNITSLLSSASITQIQSITIGSNNSSQAQLNYSAMRVDGRLLVDNGVWNVSKNWSDYLVSDNGSYRSGNTPDKAFNGDGGATICEASTKGTNSTLTFTPPSDVFTGSLNIEVLSATSTGVNVYVTDGAGTETAMSAAGNIWTATATGLTSIRVAGINATAYADMRQVTINGSVLVDSGEQWNKSEEWSDMYIGTPSSTANIPNAFDGNPNTYNTIAHTNGDTTITYTLTGLTPGSPVKISTWQSTSAAPILCNGTNITNYNQTQTLTECGILSGNTLTIVQNVDADASVSDASRIYYVEVGNKMLVDLSVGTYNTLFNAISEQEGVDTLFYDENQGGVTTLLRLMNRYGFKSAKPGCGIYELTEQPDFDVANYIKSGDYYVPTRSYSRLFKCLLKAVSVDWAATTAFTKDQIVEYNDLFYCVTADHTTGSSFVTDNLHIIQTIEAFTTAFAPAGQTSSSSY